MLSSDREAFLDAAANGANFIPLAHSWPADLETPLTTWLKIGSQNDSPGVLLESVEGGENLGRWSVVASDPLWTATSRGSKFIRTWRNGNKEELSGNPFLGLRKCLSPYKSSPLSNLPPLGQLYGMWGFEVINWIESTVPIHSRGKKDPPDGIWMLMDSILFFDQVKRVITAVAYGDLSEGVNAESAFESAFQRIEDLKSKMCSPLPSIKPLNWQSLNQSSIETKSNFSQSDFEKAVIQAKEHISAGDIFQLVLSQRLETEIDQDPFDIYRSLRMVNPSPYMAFFDFGDWHLIGSSPEVMVKAEPSLNSNEICASLRPIAGTRPRGNNEKEDMALENELLKDPKENIF